jgi:hypothetical protein
MCAVLPNMRYVGIMVVVLIPTLWIIAAWLVFRRNRTAGFVLSCLCIGFLTHVILKSGFDRGFIPPAPIHTLRAFVDETGRKYEVSVFVFGPRHYYELRPQWTTLQTLGSAALLRSGPPSYVFDLSGNLVDWTIDRDEDTRYQRKWSASAERRSCSLQEALMRVDNEHKMAEPRVGGDEALGAAAPPHPQR